MKTNMRGFNENVATFEAASGVTEGSLVKMSDDDKVAKCGSNDIFCGVCLNVRAGYAAVQLTGYVELPATEKIAVGYKKLASNGSDKAIVYASGRELLVVDSTTSTVGVIL